MIATAVHAGMIPASSRCTSEGVMTVGGRTFAPSGIDVVELPTVSSYCASCHDGVIAAAVHVTSSSSLSTSFGSVGSHPVDVRYPDGDPGYVPMAQLDPRIHVTDGTVTCTSCHPDDGAHALVFTNQKSRLCIM